ncbi:MAG: hypothetical protein L0Y32_03855, partial [Nevskiales bacterium]|nr:hypothetical protein [Nevskiales bacterium]
KPGLLTPDLHERTLTAHRVVALGAALIAHGKEPGPYRTALQRLLEDTGLRTAAEDFARAHGKIPRDPILPKLITDTVDRLG